MVHHPMIYAGLLAKKMAKHGATCWLVNTGWSGGPYGVGKRISIKHTRALLNAALDGKLAGVSCQKDKLFGFELPKSCPDVPPEILDPANTWASRDEYWNRYDSLAARFADNFKIYAEGCSKEVVAAGPKRLSQL